MRPAEPDNVLVGDTIVACGRLGSTVVGGKAIERLKESHANNEDRSPDTMALGTVIEVDMGVSAGVRKVTALWSRERRAGKL